MTNEEAEKLVAQASERLGEHFDSVFIIATKSLVDGTARFHGTFGNQFASCMCMRLAVEELEAALTADPDEDGEDGDDAANDE